MSRTAEPIVLSTEERGTLNLWARGKRLVHRLVQRAQIIRMAADGGEIPGELPAGRAAVSVLATGPRRARGRDPSTARPLPGDRARARPRNGAPAHPPAPAGPLHSLALRAPIRDPCASARQR